MSVNVFRISCSGQKRCICMLQLVSKTICSKSISDKVNLKVPIINFHIRSLSTSDWRKKDVILEADKDPALEVYKGSISNHIFRVKAFSIMTSIMGIAAQPILVQKALEAESSTGLLVGTFTFVGFFTLVTPILLHMVTRKYVVTLLYSPKSDLYTATTYSIFLGKKADNFKVEDVVIPDIPTMLTTFTVRERGYFVDKESFHDIIHYKKIMGFDKPLDLTLNEENSVKK